MPDVGFEQSYLYSFPALLLNCEFILQEAGAIPLHCQ